MRSEKEKMLSGERYDASDEELVQARFNANQFCHAYNEKPIHESQTCHPLIKKLVNTEGEFLIKPPFYCDYGFNIYLGKNVMINYGCVLLDVCPIHIGEHTLIGPSCQIYTAAHPLDADERMKGIEFGKPITIGKNVWIGGNTTILPGVTIGDHAVIGAGSVVTKDIPPYAVAVGNPCHIIKKEMKRIKTNRLCLRQMKKSDERDLFEMLSDEQTCLDDGGYPAFTTSESFHPTFLNFLRDEHRYVIELEEEKKVIGLLNIMEPEVERSVAAKEVGYLIHPKYRQKGFGKEAVQALIEDLFKQDVKMIVCTCFEYNLASSKLLESLGFVQEGKIHNSCCHPQKGWIDSFSYYKEKEQ